MDITDIMMIQMMTVYTLKVIVTLTLIIVTIARLGCPDDDITYVMMMIMMMILVHFLKIIVPKID